MNKKHRNGRAIVTYGRSLIALMIARSLGSRGIDVIGCDDVKLTVLSFSKFVSKNLIYTAPEKNEEKFIEDLLEIVRSNKPDDEYPYVLIPAFRDAKIIAKHKKRFEGLVTVACPDFEAIDKIDHKDEFAKTVQELGVESPKTWLPQNEEDIECALEEIKFPVFVKPPDDVGGRGISRVENEEELKTAFKDLQNRYPDDQILIQSLAKGVDYCFCGLFDQGNLIASMVYHNIRKFPQESGPGVVRETVKSERFDEIAEKLMKPLQWHGVAGIDFMWDENEKSIPTMIEVNPRFWAGLDHSVKSNIDFPWLLYQLFVDGKVDIQDEADVGCKTSLPGLSTMARIESLFSEAFNFDDLEKKIPEIKTYLKNQELTKAIKLFKDALSNSITLDEAYDNFKTIVQEAKQVESISYGKDDPFVGLGALFILGSLIKHGELPPEITR